MKKIIALLLCALMVLSLCSCSSSKPEAAVENFSEALTKWDIEAMAKTMVDGNYDPAAFDMEDDFGSMLLDYMTSELKNVKYKIGKVTTNGDTATVEVTYTYTDASPIVTSALGDYITQALVLAFSGATEEEMLELFGTIFEDKVKSTDTGTTESTMTFTCTKVGNTWLISEVPDEILNVITCNISAAMEAMGDIFEN